jgi:hypothetical protein
MTRAMNETGFANAVHHCIEIREAAVYRDAVNASGQHPIHGLLHI